MIQNYVYIVKKTHQYFDLDGNEYTPVSRVLDTLKVPFDPNIAYQCAGKGKYVGMTPEQVLAQWDHKRNRSSDHGTRVHDAIENYTQDFTIEEKNRDLEPMLKSIASEYIPYSRTYAECVLYSPSLAKVGTRIAGTTDRIMIVSARGGYADIEDYKTNLERGIEFFNEKNKYFLEPMTHLQECNYNRYCLQLSVYGVMYEELTLNKVRSMWLRFIPHNDPLAHRRIPVPYLKNDAISVLNNYHLSRKQVPVVNKLEEQDGSIEIPTFD